MFAVLPRQLRRAAVCEVAAILLLLLSLFCSTAVPYLITIGLGSFLMFLGLVFTILTLIKAMRADRNT